MIGIFVYTQKIWIKLLIVLNVERNLISVVVLHQELFIVILDLDMQYVKNVIIKKLKQKKMTQQQVNKKYIGRYVNISKTYNYQQQEWDYVVNKSYKKIHENTTLGEDVGTQMEYKR
jgi:hypothetical protein